MEDEGEDKDDNKRKFRNLSEKKRRDQFNLLVNELNSMVSTDTRKMDKSTVLKSTIIFLKNHNDIAVKSKTHEIQENWKPSFLSNEEFTHLTLEALDGFIMVFSTSGRIVYASESISSLLGHLPSDLLNTTIFDLAYEDDRPNLFNLLRTSTSNLDNIQDFSQENQFSFTCHLKRGALDFREEPSYEVVYFVGYFRFSNDSLEADELVSNNFNVTSGAPRLIFVATGRLQTPQLIKEMSVVDSSKSEFTSRHSLEWKFLFLDHRAPPIIGYLPFEVLGTSGYDYYHFDDLEKVVTCHESLMQKGEGTSCYYRFLTKGQQWIWLQTRFYITYHQWSSKPEFVVCTHRVVSYADVLNQSPKETEDLQLDTPNVTMGDQMMSIEETKYFPEEVQQSHLPPPSRMSEGIAWSHSSQSSKHSTSGNISQYESASSSINASRMTSGRIHNSGVVVMESSWSQVPVQQDLRVQTITAQGIQYVDASYVATVPIQPVIGGFPSQALATTGPQIQEQLQKKHEELQQMIIYQQEELRRVSEQLVMARYGLVPPIINVSLPYNQLAPDVVASTSCITTGAPALPMPISTEGFRGPSQMPNQIMHTQSDNSSHELYLHDRSAYVPMQISQQQAQFLTSSGSFESHLIENPSFENRQQTPQ